MIPRVEMMLKSQKGQKWKESKIWFLAFRRKRTRNRPKEFRSLYGCFSQYTWSSRKDHGKLMKNCIFRGCKNIIQACAKHAEAANDGDFFKVYRLSEELRADSLISLPLKHNNDDHSMALFFNCVSSCLKGRESKSKELRNAYKTSK